MAEATDKKKKEGEKGEGEAPAPAAAAAPASKKKTMLIVGGVVVLLLAIGVPVAIFSLKPKAADQSELAADAASHEPQLHAEGTHDEDELAEDEEALGAFFPFENFVVNLSGKGYVRAQIQLEFASKDVPKRFYARIVPARDVIIELLSQRTQEDLLSEKGKEAAKSDIKDSINELLKKEEVKNVYFTQFFVQ